MLQLINPKPFKMVSQFKISDDLVKQKLIYSCMKLYLKR